MTCTVMIAGAGGQGTLMAGRILAEAAMREGKHVTWFPSYGAAMRGGTANCTVIISDSPIGSPVAIEIDALIALNEQSLLAFEHMLVTGGFLIMDSTNIKAAPSRDDVGLVSVPVKSLSAELGLLRPANIMLLGAFAASNDAVLDPDAVADALKRVGLKDLGLNGEAFRLGKEYILDKKSQDI